MRSEVMEHYGLTKEFRKAGYYETEHHRQLLKDLRAAVKQGAFVALSGIVGSGKTTLLKRLQDLLEHEGEVLVSKSLAVDKERVNLGTLILALFYDLSTEKELRVPPQAERREWALRELIKKRKKPIALFIDDAHDLSAKTLVELKRLIEMVQDGVGTFAVVLVGHPKLRNELRRSTMEEIGNRATVFSLEGTQANNREFIYWLLAQCTERNTLASRLFEEEAIDLLAERLATPLQIEQHLTLALEEAFQIGGKPVTPEVVESVLSKDINEMEPTLTRHGYTSRVLADLLNVHVAEIKKFLRG